VGKGCPGKTWLCELQWRLRSVRKLIGVTEACGEASQRAREEPLHTAPLNRMLLITSSLSLSANIKDIRAGGVRCSWACLCELCLDAFADVQIWFKKKKKKKQTELQ